MLSFSSTNKEQDVVMLCGFSSFESCSFELAVKELVSQPCTFKSYKYTL